MFYKHSRHQAYNVSANAGRCLATHLCNPANMNGVFTEYAKSTINAPIETVWGVFTDFENYSKWNSYVRSGIRPDQGPALTSHNLARSQILTDASFQPLVE